MQGLLPRWRKRGCAADPAPSGGADRSTLFCRWRLAMTKVHQGCEPFAGSAVSSRLRFQSAGATSTKKRGPSICASLLALVHVSLAPAGTSKMPASFRTS